MEVRPSLGTYAGLFMITLTTLMYEILLTRIFSVIMWFHFAFVAISIALFGLTVGALIVYLLPNLFPEQRTRDRLWQASVLFSVSIVVSFLAMLSIPFRPEFTVLGVYSVGLFYIVVSVPFIFSGVVVSLCLTRFPRRIGRLYAVDLVGAALGTVTLIWLLNLLRDGPSAVLAAAGLAAVAASFFAFRATNRLHLTLIVVSAVALAAMAAGNAVSVQHHHPVLKLRWTKTSEETFVPLFERWNGFSRIRVIGNETKPSPPAAHGLSPTYADRFKPAVPLLLLDLDAMIATPLTRFDGDLDPLIYLQFDLSNIAHHIRPDSDVVVVGSGGGRDVLSALSFGQRSVTAIDMNGATLDALNGTFGDFTGHLDQQPGVTFVNDEGRSYLARTDDRFDIIQIPMADTFAASSAGAFSLTESGLYTVEAWELFLERLTDTGVLSVTRWYQGFSAGNWSTGTPLESLRLTSLAVASLQSVGVEDPRNHVMLAKSAGAPNAGAVVTMLVSREPFSSTDVQEFEQVTRDLQFELLVTPHSVGPVSQFAEIFEVDSPNDLELGVSADISAPTDNRPFFFQMAQIEDLLRPWSFNGLRTNLARPVLVIVTLSVAVLVLTTFFILVPLILTTSRAALRGVFPYVAYFSAIGLGFLLLEIAQMQRLVIFLGHPTFALSVVLFSLLLFSGLGSLTTERFVNPKPSGGPQTTLLWPLVALLGLLVILGLVTPDVIDQFEAETTPVRIAVAVGMLAPMGFLMGMPFPLGMRIASLNPNAPTVLFWGINGATSVCASVLAIAISMGWGISSAYWLGWLCYVGAAAALTVVVFRWRPAS